MCDRTKIRQPPEEVSQYDRAAIGYYLHSFYNGCENIFDAVARFFENDISSGAWHTNLLKRMTLDIPGFRPPVIDEELFQLLDDFRGFRHKFRYSYTFDLDWEKERLVGKKLQTTFQMFRKQIEEFISLLEELQN